MSPEQFVARLDNQGSAHFRRLVFANNTPLTLDLLFGQAIGDLGEMLVYIVKKEKGRTRVEVKEEEKKKSESVLTCARLEANRDGRIDSNHGRTGP